MTKHTVKCQSCSAEVVGELYHAGFSDMEGLYCSSCPRVLLLKDWHLLEQRGIRLPPEGSFQYYNRHMLSYYAQVEALFRQCQCGGHYGYMNSPRCPVCSGLLRGDSYEDKPILKQQDGFVFVTTGSVDDHEQRK